MVAHRSRRATYRESLTSVAMFLAVAPGAAAAALALDLALLFPPFLGIMSAVVSANVQDAT